MFIKIVQEHCKEHFREEEKELFPLIDSVYRMQRIEGDISNWSNSGWVGQVVSATELTHSRLFPFFIAGLLPQEAMEYVDLICRSTRDPQQLASMLQSLTSLLEGTCQSSFIFDSLLRKWNLMVLWNCWSAFFFVCTYIRNRINLATVSTAWIYFEMRLGIGNDLKMLVNKIETGCFIFPLIFVFALLVSFYFNFYSFWDVKS